MQHDIQVLDRVKSAYATLRPSEQRVADQVLADPEKCTRCTIAELADQVQVSQPTVVRFVQALGFDGYRSFKYCLLRDRSGKSPKTPTLTTWVTLTSSPGTAWRTFPSRRRVLRGDCWRTR